MVATNWKYGAHVLLIVSLFVFSGCQVHAQAIIDITDQDGGVVSSQYNDSPSGETIENLIDNNSGSKYLTFHASAWLMFETSKPYVLTKYSITSANDAPERDPKDWSLEGSYNGLSFFVIDERENQDFAGRGIEREFIIDGNTGSYPYYRLKMNNHSGDIFQLAELKLFGTEGAVYSGLLADFRTNSYLVTESPVLFINGSLNASSYHWTFEGGIPETSTTESPEVIYHTPGDYQVTLTVNDGHSTVSKTSSITVKDIDDWSDFFYPIVDLECTNTNNYGYLKYMNLVTDKGFNDIQEFVQHCCLVVAQKLYFTVDEANEHGLRAIHYKLTEGGALSYKGGDVHNIEIGFNMDYLNSFAEDHDNDVCADEIYGILCHEICHGYQNSPSNCGSYGSPNEYYGFIEGTADLARLLTGGFNPQRYPSIGGSWIDGYNTTAFFYLWIQNEKQDEDFLKKLNKSALNINPWSINEAMMQVYGESVQSLWDRYQASLRTVGVNDVDQRSLGIFLQNGGSELVLRDLPSGENHVSICNMTGCVLSNAVILNQKEGLINVEFLLPGIYIICVENKGIISSQKFIK